PHKFDDVRSEDFLHILMPRRREDGFIVLDNPAVGSVSLSLNSNPAERRRLSTAHPQAMMTRGRAKIARNEPRPIGAGSFLLEGDCLMAKPRRLLSHGRLLVLLSLGMGLGWLGTERFAPVLADEPQEKENPAGPKVEAVLRPMSDFYKKAQSF